MTNTFCPLCMPLELGLAIARRFIDPATEHDWLVLVPRGHTYIRFISDSAAYDPATHDGFIASVVAVVMSWLATRDEAIPPVTPKEVLAVLPAFQEERQTLAHAWAVSRPGPISSWRL